MFDKISKIKLFSQVFELRKFIPSKDNPKAMGRFSEYEGRFLINEKLKDPQKAITIIHEVTHAIADINNINLSETKITIIANGFYSLIKENPDLIKEIIHE